MDLIEKIRAAFAKRLGTKPSLVTVKPVGERLLVFVVSGAFADMSPWKRQRLVTEALRGTDSPLTPAERRRIGLVRTLTPQVAGKIIEDRKVRRRGRPRSPSRIRCAAVEIDLRPDANGRASVARPSRYNPGADAQPLERHFRP